MRADDAGAGGVGAAARGPERRRRAGRGASAQLGARLAARIAPARLGPHPVRAGPRLRAPCWHVRIAYTVTGWTRNINLRLRLPPPTPTINLLPLWPIIAALIPSVSILYNIRTRTYLKFPFMYS